MAAPRLDRLPLALRRRISAARVVARDQKTRLFLVGGAVRDVLLGRVLEDLDFAVEGDAAAFARALARRLGGKVREHGRFGTASVELAGGGRCDVAAARSETYESPGALPRVRPASIAEDLGRRDFTVNAMAMLLTPGQPRLLDPFGGRRDLSARTLRFLHPRSPCDDPTRAFRAVRYANRLGFRISRDSTAAIRLAIAKGAFDAVSGDRLRRELDLIFGEPDPASAVARMRALCLIPVLGADLPADLRALTRLRRAEALALEGKVERVWPLFLLVWASGLPERELKALADRLALGGAPGRAVRQWETAWRNLESIRTSRLPSRIRRLCAGLSAAEIGALAAGLDRGAAERLLRASRPIRLSIGGRDLIAAGVPPGPSVGRALAATREALEDGMIGPGQELDFALRRARGRGRRQ